MPAFLKNHLRTLDSGNRQIYLIESPPQDFFSRARKDLRRLGGKQTLDHGLEKWTLRDQSIYLIEGRQERRRLSTGSFRTDFAEKSRFSTVIRTTPYRGGTWDRIKNFFTQDARK